jgi:hypothetical protein
MLYAYFGGLGADRQTIHEILLELQGARYAVAALTIPRPLTQDSVDKDMSRRWFRRSSRAPTTRQLYGGQDGRMALRTLFWAACAANSAAHGQRFCYVLSSVPVQPGVLATLIPAQLRSDGSLPIHPQLWQVGRSLDTLPVERHEQACMDASAAIKLTAGGRSLDEGFLR